MLSWTECLEVMMKSKKKSTLKIWISVFVVSAILTYLLNPGVEYIYPLKYEEQIEEYSHKYGLDKYLVMGIISSESNFDPDARSNKDAHGLMQIKDETALWCVEEFEIDVSKDKVREPEVNIQIGCAYMRYLIDTFGGNTITAIAAYNAGPGNVENWLNDPRYSDGHGELLRIPFSETSAYVTKVQKRAKIYKKIYG